MQREVVSPPPASHVCGRSMKTKPKLFGAVAESRRWKEAVARETERMTRAEVLAFFARERVFSALQQTQDRSAVVREERSER